MRCAGCFLFERLKLALLQNCNKRCFVGAHIVRPSACRKSTVQKKVAQIYTRIKVSLKPFQRLAGSRGGALVAVRRLRNSLPYKELCKG